MSDINRQTEKDGLSIKGKDPHVVFKQLSLRVKESPSDLKRHIQRILFCIDSNLTESVSGALQDLFITLEDNGMNLRVRMFGLVSPLIDYTERAYFHQWLSEGTDSNLECQQFEGAIFQSKTCKPANKDSNQ